MSVIGLAKCPFKKGRSLHSRVPHFAAEGLIAPAASTQPSTPSITISDEPFSLGFDVGLSHPADGDNRSREFQGYPNALAYARVLRLEFGVPIIDCCGERS